MTSPTFTSASASKSSRYKRPTRLPRKMPSARLDCTMAAAPDCGSVSKRTVAVLPLADTTWPTTPEVPMTVWPVEMPSLAPLLMMTVWLHASELRPMTRAPVPSIW